MLGYVRKCYHKQLLVLSVLQKTVNECRSFFSSRLQSVCEQYGMEVLLFSSKNTILEMRRANSLRSTLREFHVLLVQMKYSEKASDNLKIFVNSRVISLVCRIDYWRCESVHEPWWGLDVFGARLVVSLSPHFPFQHGGGTAVIVRTPLRVVIALASFLGFGMVSLAFKICVQNTDSVEVVRIQRHLDRFLIHSIEKVVSSWWSSEKAMGGALTKESCVRNEIPDASLKASFGYLIEV
ncbi:hypothetical protein Tco_0535743 [Tanacetum coccineum]